MLFGEGIVGQGLPLLHVATVAAGRVGIVDEEVEIPVGDPPVGIFRHALRVALQFELVPVRQIVGRGVDDIALPPAARISLRIDPHGRIEPPPLMQVENVIGNADKAAGEIDHADVRVLAVLRKPEQTVHVAARAVAPAVAKGHAVEAGHDHQLALLEPDAGVGVGGEGTQRLIAMDAADDQHHRTRLPAGDPVDLDFLGGAGKGDFQGRGSGRDLSQKRDGRPQGQANEQGNEILCGSHVMNEMSHGRSSISRLHV
ncbi:MAG: hypothetical protein A4E73_01095 [Syntrophaceae bacterium PtaU1.Bin231]|nr:MAG: hypothetical protein A4E73_01095 [Syntrophaceae bacterium PtaU1.Bin231]